MSQRVRFRKSRKRWVNNRFDLGSLAHTPVLFPLFRVADKFFPGMTSTHLMSIPPIFEFRTQC
jgi:hypothetical protein